MKCSYLCWVIVLILNPSAYPQSESSVFHLVQSFDSLAAQPLWPGFEPRKTPLEIFDGKNTYLLRHPTPPPEFKPVFGHAGFLMYEGKHPSVRANTSVELAGVLTATLEDSMDPAVLIHECFHVFERQKHPSWAANEAALFIYPVEDSQALALSRLELEAMSRALGAANPACWSARVRALRLRRFTLLPKDAVAYERGNELNEGLAQYVEGLSANRNEVKFRTFGPEEVRQRGYVSGEALARLLDKLDVNWKMKVTNALDTLLPDSYDSTCDFTPTETRSAESEAAADIAKLKDQRTEVMKAFESQHGWRVTVEAANGKPLMPAGFDPLNVSRLSAEMVLHKRWVKLQTGSGSLEIMNHGSVTTGTDVNPLFGGVKEWRTAGLLDKPEIKQDGTHLTLSSAAVRMDFARAQSSIDDKAEVILIRLE